MENTLFAFALTALAGLSTGFGGLAALYAKKTGGKFLAFSLGFSAGIMIYVSMVEIFSEAREKLSGRFGEKTGSAFAVLAFFGGILFIAIIDRLITGDNNPHEVKSPCGAASTGTKRSLLKTGMFTALAITIHNFPEGLAAFAAAQREPSIAVPVIAAIAIHNVPEGIAVAIPIYCATGSRRRAFLYSFLSGLAEPVGAGLGYLILMQFMNDTVYGILFASVAGIMIFISLDELLPSAREYGEHHLSIYGLIAGMFVIASSLILFM